MRCSNDYCIDKIEKTLMPPHFYMLNMKLERAACYNVYIYHRQRASKKTDTCQSIDKVSKISPHALLHLLFPSLPYQSQQMATPPLSPVLPEGIFLLKWIFVFPSSQNTSSYEIVRSLALYFIT